MSQRRPVVSVLAACVAVLALAACQPGGGTGQDGAEAESAGPASGVMATGAWIRETPPNAGVAGGYLTLRSAVDDRLLRVETPAAASVEIHEMSHEGGMMQMRELADGVELPAGGKVELRPGGTHLMFIDPVEPMRAGQTIDATLHFEHAGVLSLRFEVRPLDGEAHTAH